MAAIPSEKELFSTIAGVIAEALCIDVSAIRLDSRLFLDLDAESIDIVDIRFRIEEIYRMKINQDDLMSSLGDGLSEREIGERFTTQALVAHIGRALRGGQAA